jgi:hypothetical protein
MAFSCTHSRVARCPSGSSASVSQVSKSSDAWGWKQGGPLDVIEITDPAHPQHIGLNFGGIVVELSDLGAPSVSAGFCRLVVP